VKQPEKRTQVTFEMISELGADTYPDVPTSPEVDIAALTAPDVAAGSEPMFVTLPIFQSDILSRNGIFYDRKCAEAVLSAINDRRIGGQLGHIPLYDRSYVFDTFNVYWVGAIIDSGGKVWGKFYVPTTETRLREYIRVSLATNARIGTSIYGYAEEITEDNRAIGLYVEQIDMGHPDRLGVPLAAALPKVTGELVNMDKDKVNTPSQQDAPTTPAPVQQTAPESADLAEIKRKNQDLLASNQELNSRNRALVNQAADANSVRELLNLTEGVDLVSSVRSLRDRVGELEAENARLLNDRITSEVDSKVRVPAVRPVVVAMVKQEKPVTMAQVQSAVEKVISLDYIKGLLANSAQAQMGPPPPVPANLQPTGTAGAINIPQRPTSH